MKNKCDKYCIVNGYKINGAPGDYINFDGEVNEWDDLRFQKHVYEKVLELMQLHKYQSILDIGCGSGRKLMKYFSQYETHGIDIEPCYERLKRLYPERNWYVCNYNIPFNKNVDVIICADVIEHIIEPDEVMKYIVDINPKCIAMSTPVRELLPKKLQDIMGPPDNHFHIREWTTKEFENYCLKWFDINKYAMVYNFHWGNTGITKIFFRRDCYDNK